MQGDFTGTVIVSMTAISSRVALLPRVLESLLTQSRPPDILYLNVSDHAKYLDNGIDFSDLPVEVRSMVVDGRVRLTFGPNTGPYRKLVPALQRHMREDCVIVTADDDVVYPPNWLAALVDAHRRTGNMAAYRCRAIVYKGGALAPYRTWPHIEAGGDADFGEILPEFHPIFRHPTGRGGILYRPQHFRDRVLLETFRRLAPMQDDLGFKMMALLKRLPVDIVPASEAGGENANFRRAGPTEVKLQSGNKTGNDLAVAALFDHVISRGLFSWERYIGSGGAA